MRYPKMHLVNHPKAALAVRLSVMLHGAHPDLITTVLHRSGCPRPLFVLASVLRAAAAWEERSDCPQ